jgi:hypothetical protein
MTYSPFFVCDYYTWKKQEWQLFFAFTLHVGGGALDAPLYKIGKIRKMTEVW